MRLRGMTAVAALVLGLFATNSFAADNVAPTKAELEEMYNADYRAFDAKKFSEALKQLDAIDARQPDLDAARQLRQSRNCITGSRPYRSEVLECALQPGGDSIPQKRLGGGTKTLRTTALQRRIRSGKRSFPADPI